jgi:cyclooctat-9-en-7-ol 5-monooxygenase
MATEGTSSSTPNVGMTSTLGGRPTAPRAARVSPAPVVPRALPVLGHTLELLRDPIGTLQRARSVGDVAQVRLGPFSALAVNSPELIRRLLVGQVKDFNRGRLMSKAAEYLGEGVLFSDGAFHMRQRRLAQQAFHGTRMASYTATMSERVEALAGAWRPGQRIDWYGEATGLAADIVGSTLVAGERGRKLADAFRTALPALTRDFGWQIISPAKWVERLPTTPNRRLRSLSERLGRTVEDEVATARRCPTDRGDLLSVFLGARDPETGQPMSTEQVGVEMVNILAAAIETTSITLAWLFYEIAAHPDVQDRLHAEVDGVVARRTVTWADLPALPYTRRLIDETLRLHHPNWLLMRQANDDTELGGYAVPAGRQILISPTTLHRDPALYPHPLRFDPDRWDTAPPDGAFLPFISGRHKCLGEQFALAEMTVALATIAARWRLVPAGSRPPREVVRATVRPDAVLVRVCPR